MGSEMCIRDSNIYSNDHLGDLEPPFDCDVSITAQLEQSLKAEQIIKKYINEAKELYKLNNSQICLSGFSQGCMMSINIGLTSDENFNLKGLLLSQ